MLKIDLEPILLLVEFKIMTMLRRSLITLLLASLFTCLNGIFLVSPTLALGGEQPLLNQPAPEFNLPTNGEAGQVSLVDYRGKWVVLYFYPKDFTPGCTLEAKRFQQDLPKYIDRHTQIIGVSADNVKSHAEFCDSEGLKFPLLADTTGEISKIYGSWLAPMSLRHTYIIDPDGILRDRFLGVRPAIHSTEVLARLDELQAQNLNSYIHN